MVFCDFHDYLGSPCEVLGRFVGSWQPRKISRKVFGRIFREDFSLERFSSPAGKTHPGLHIAHTPVPRAAGGGGPASYVYTSLVPHAMPDDFLTLLIRLPKCGRKTSHPVNLCRIRFRCTSSAPRGICPGTYLEPHVCNEHPVYHVSIDQCRLPHAGCRIN